MERDNSKNYDQTDPNFNAKIIEENYSDLQHLKKIAGDNQDLLEDKDNDPNRRTLDEYDVNDAEPDADDSE